MKKLIFTVAAFLALNMAVAQAPEGFKYQAVVRDASSAIVASSPIGVQVRILQGGSAGAPVYVETHTGITNTYGLMSLTVGGGTVSSGSFSGIDWSAGPYFMEISMDISGGTSYTTMGSSQLLSVPYALYAGSVAGGSGGDADADPANELNTAFSLTGTTLSITDPGGTLNVDLTTVAGGDDADADPTNEYNTGVSLSGTTLSVTDAGGSVMANLSSLVNDADADPTNEYITSASLSGTTLNIVDGAGTHAVDMSSLSGGGGNWTLSGSNIYNSNPGYVGVGETAPASKLHVNATGTTANPHGAQIFMDNPSGTTSSAGLRVESTGNSAAELVGVYTSSTVTSSSWSKGMWAEALGSTDVNRGVQGATDGTGTGGNEGVIGFSVGAGVGTENTGVYGAGYGTTGDNYGVHGASYGPTGAATVTGVKGEALGSPGDISRGVRGESQGGGTDAIGVSGVSTGNATWNCGMEAFSTGTGTYNIGIYASGADATYGAGYFSGDVYVSGTLGKAGGTFRIDHPQDPENKYLVHSFVESPDMMNIYNGNVTTDSEGYAVVTMPDYFDALNKDFRYQLTVIGTFAQAIVKEEISGNTFIIQTSEPGVKVSWQVTGVRKDKWAEANRVVPEETKEKPGYIHPELYGLPKEEGIFYKESHVDENRTVNIKKVSR